jgi:hypothetical protein
MGTHDRLPERTARLTPETLPALHFFDPCFTLFGPSFTPLYTFLTE